MIFLSSFDLKSLNSPIFASNELPCTLIVKLKKLNLCMLNSFKDFYLCIKQATMWYFYCQNNKSSICACSVVPMVFIYASNELSSSILIIKIKNLNLCMLNRAIMWYPDNQLRIKLNLCIVLKENKNILCKNQISIKNMY